MQKYKLNPGQKLMNQILHPKARKPVIVIVLLIQHLLKNQNVFCVPKTYKVNFVSLNCERLVCKGLAWHNF